MDSSGWATSTSGTSRCSSGSCPAGGRRHRYRGAGARSCSEGRAGYDELTYRVACSGDDRTQSGPSRPCGWSCCLLAAGALAPRRPHLQGPRPGSRTYQSRDAHRFTAMSMLTGSLKYHYSLVSLVGDEQVYDGAGYTNWGYGVPLSSSVPRGCPPHGVAALRVLPGSSDLLRYLALTAAILWAGWTSPPRTGGEEARSCHRFGGTCSRPGRPVAASCAGVYPSIAAHLHVYDETIVYLVFTELVAMSAYVFLLGSRGWAPVVALAAAARLGLLTRPTGAIFLAMWAVLVVLERPCKRAAIVFLGSVAPVRRLLDGHELGAHGLIRNGASVFRTGCSARRPRGLQQRLRQPSASTTGTTRCGPRAPSSMLFFILVPERQPFLKDCQFAVRTPYLGGSGNRAVPKHGRAALPRMDPASQRIAATAYAGVLSPSCRVRVDVRLVRLRGCGCRLALRRRFLAAGLRCCRSSTCGPCPWWPRRYSSAWPLAAVLLTGAYSSYEHHVEPTKKEIENIDAGSDRAHAGGIREHARSGQDKILPVEGALRQSPGTGHTSTFPGARTWAGWEPDCGVRTVTEIFLGVPPSKPNDYLRRSGVSETSGMSSASADLLRSMAACTRRTRPPVIRTRAQCTSRTRR